MFGTGGNSRFNPCVFEGANLRYVDLSGAKLKDAVFKGADLSFANLTGADLRGADFRGAKMEVTILEDARTDGTIFDRDDSRPVFKIRVSADDGE